MDAEGRRAVWPVPFIANTERDWNSLVRRLQHGDADTVTNISGAPIAVGRYPASIVVTPGGKTVYVANGGSNTVTPINIATTTSGSA